MNGERLDLSLYLVADEIHFRKGLIEDQIVKAVLGGVRVVQLREKRCSTEEFTRLARRVLQALKPYRVPVVINDRVDVAKAVGAQGAHLGQSDLSPQEARRILGPNAIIGLSVEAEEHLAVPHLSVVDYLGVSAVFPTETKNDIRKVWGLEGLKRLKGMTALPLIGIGGIQESNIAQVAASGADGAAIISDFKAHEDWKAKAKRLRAEFERCSGR